MKTRKIVVILVPLLIVLFLIGITNQPPPLNSRNGSQAIENSIEPVQGATYLTSSDNIINPLAKRETVFYGMADDPSVRNIVGYADYILCSHALYSSGATIRDNVRYLSDHGVKVILVSGWWDVWPFTGAGINGWEDMHMEDVVYGMNATESAKYRIRQMMDEIGAEYVWGISIGEEEPAGDEPFPWEFITWYMNLFYDWIHDEYPGVNVLQWIQPIPFYLQQADNLKADAIIYDNYNQNYTEIAGIASQLKTAYPTTPLLFLISGVEHTAPWFTCHPPTYTKRAVAAIAPYADVIGFWFTDDFGNEGWEVEHEGYKLTQRICNQIHLMDANTIYGNTEWFECGFGNDTVTDSIDNWYRSYWKDEPPDTDLLIENSTDNQVGDYSVNLTCTDIGTHSFWWQYLGHDYGFPDWPGIPNSLPINMTEASRITFWIKGVGWENHPTGTARIYIECSNYPLGFPGNLTLPEITSYLADGQWHRVTIDLPLPPSSYYDWEGYCSQLRIEVDYPGSVVSNTVSILFDGWVVESFDTGKAYGLSSTSDYVSVVNGTMYIGGDAYFESHFPQATAWYYQYSGTGDIEMLINGTWTDPPDVGTLCRWNVSAFRLSNGTFEWIKVNAIPPIVDILYPIENSLLSGQVEVQVNATDESGIDRVEFSIDGSLLYVDTTYPYSYTWDTTEYLDGVHLLNVTAWSEDLNSNYHDIEVTIDNTAPSLIISTPEEDAIVTGYVSISALADDVSGIASVEFFLDGLSLFIDYLFPYEYTWDTLGVSDGIHNITCEAKDLAGNARIESRLVKVDNLGPTLSIHSVSVWGSSGQIVVNTSDPSGIDRVEFYFEGGLEEVDYTYPYEWVWSDLLLPDGNYTITAISYDILNHSTAVSSEIEIDNTLPSLSVTWTPPQTDLNGVVSFSAVASDSNGIAYVEYYLDGVLQTTGYFVPYSWVWDTTVVLDGNHTIEVIAVDNMGNSKAIAVALNVDNSEPVIFVNSPANHTVLSGPSAVSVLVTVQDALSIDTVLLSYYSGSSWISIEMTPSGSYFEATTPVFPIDTEVLFRIYANDTLGNSDWSLIYVCNIVDLTTPLVDIEITPSTPVLVNTVQINVSVTDDSSISMVIIYIDGTPMAWLSSAPYSWSWDTSVHVDGDHTVTAWANDTMNNSGFTETSVTTDNSGPQVVINSPLNASVFEGPCSISVLATVLDASTIDTVLLSYDSGLGWTSISMVISGTQFEGTITGLQPGETVLVRIYANDSLGNEQWSTQNTYYVVDETSPSVSFVLIPDIPIYSGTVNIEATVSDLSGISLVIFYVDGVPVATDASAPFEYILDTGSLNDGVHTLRVWANDTWNNTNYSEVSIETDNSSPIIIVNSPADGTIYDAPVRVSIESSVGDSHDLSHVLVFYTTGSTWISEPMVLSGSIYIWNSSLLSSGTTLQFYVYANDTIGNEASSSVYECQVHDLSGPIITTPTISPIAPTSFDTVVISATISDHSSVDTVILSYQVNSGSWINITMSYNSLYWTSLPAMATGNNVSYRIYANDTLNHWTSTPIYGYTVVPFDVLPPDIFDTSWTPLVPDESQTIDVMINASDQSGVVDVILSYHDGLSWHNISMILSSGQYTAQIPPQSYGTSVTLKVYASDGQGNWGITPIGSFTIVSDDLEGPVLGLLSWDPAFPTEENDVEVYAEISDTNGIQTALLCFGHGTMFANVSMTFNGSGYVAIISARPIGAQVDLCVYSCDERDNWAVGSWSMYIVQPSDAIAPLITDVEWLPQTPYSNESIHVNATVSDENSIGLVLLGYYDGAHWRNLTMMYMSSNPDRYVAQIPAIGVAGTIQIWILAQDSKGNWGYTEYMDIEVRPEPLPTIPTTTPSTTIPTSPTGPAPPDTTMILIIGGAGWAVVVILVVVFRIKKK